MARMLSSQGPFLINFGINGNIAIPVQEYGLKLQ
jgi:hypothetical protein